MEDSASPETQSPTPMENLKSQNTFSSKNTFHIGGIGVEFPYKPYGTQLAFMNRVISTLDRSQREGHSHALLESPTGTGKSLSLLCSVIAWQQNQKLKNIRENLTHSSSRANPEAITDPINHGGGFIPETQPSGNTAPPVTTNSKKEKSRLAPTIFYASRTHGQITQVIREYKKTTYRVPMAVLGSKKHYCTNSYLRGTDNVDEQCKLLLKDKEDSCPEFKNANKLKAHPSLQKGGCHEVHDIEDLVKIGQVVKGCSYFAARSMAQDAELVFCPYNYIINPIIRKAMEVDITGSIIIFDEAHNIEDITRDAGSIDLEEDVLLHLQTELGQLSLNDGMTYQPLFEMIQDVLSWIDRRKNTLEKREFQRYSHCWTGDKALKELQEANISQQSFSILQECAKKAIKAATEAEVDGVHLSGMAANTLEGLFSSLNYFFSGNGGYTNDYQLALQRFVKKEGTGGWTNTFSLWCLNPSVVFKSIAELSQSVILTSGTLSPLNTFSSELGIQFGTTLEAPHVIDVDSQVWSAAISRGHGNYPLNASYKTADDYAFQDSIGKSLEDICMVVPGGCLVFFPSYKLLDKVSTRWQETGQWSRLNARKSLFVEPRGSNQDAFEPVLKGYYNSIRQGTKQVNGRKTRGKRLGIKNGVVPDSPKDTKKEGATFLAVCRGKVSEGMDFSDDNARAVVIIGIPFPNIYDIKIAQKKKFNDTYELSKKLLNGNEWYCQQAFRALNQATGRCIRHRFDYGAIIFLDERFHNDRNRAYISKWLRKSIRLYNCWEESLDGLKSFFKDVKDRIGTAVNPSEMPDIDYENVKPVIKKGGTRKKNTKVIKSCYQQKVESNNIASEKAYEKGSNRREYIDLDGDFENHPRLSATPVVALPLDDDELTIVKETPGINCNSPLTAAEICSKNSSPTTYLPSLAHPQQYSPQPSILNLRSGPTKIICSPLATPERGLSPKLNSTEPEAEFRSVNSHDWKRRKFINQLSIGPLHSFSSPVAQVHSPLASSVTTSDTNHKTEEINYPKEFSKSKYSIPPSDSDGSIEHSGLNMDQRLQIFCSCCRNPLGLPENDLFIMCSTISTSKVHLTTLLKKMSETEVLSTSSVDVLVSDTLSVDQRLCQTTRGASEQGIWCKEDGCVFNSIFCPFCIDSNQCLGVQVVATDVSNNKFQNKMLFYLDRLEIKNTEQSKHKVQESHDDKISTVEDVKFIKIERFAYTSPSQDSQGWRSTKSRMRLPKKS